jgi:transglutaminase-like putative cysteine protease
MTPKQAWASLTAVGVLGTFAYAGGLILPSGQVVLAALAIIPQAVLWISKRATIDFSPLVMTWTDLSGQITNLLTRLWDWGTAQVNGITVVDPVVTALVWSIILWLVGTWAGWHMRRNRQALHALAPGGAMMALVLGYSRGDVELLIVYLAILLALMGLMRDEWRHAQWQQHKMDYAESIRFDTLMMVGVITIGLTLSAAGSLSFSWQELMDKLRKTDQTTEDHLAESLGLERPVDPSTTAPYRSGGLPRSHLLDTPPELLKDVVMTISTGELPPIPETVVDVSPNRYYWRTITYDKYSGTGWSSSQAQDILLPANTPLLESPRDFRPVTQHIKQISDQHTNVYWTGSLGQVDTEIKIAWRTQPPTVPGPTSNVDMLGALTDQSEYTVISYVPQFNVEQLRTAGIALPEGIVNRYLALPPDMPERVLTLARTLTQSAPTPYDRAIAIENYLRKFPYTLEVEPPPPDRDVVDYFLFTAQQGYCDYYSTSMVVLARAAGLPARVVVGYTSGEYHAPTAEYIIRGENAHSWVEIYFSGIGWIEFEPTAGQPTIDRSGSVDASEPPPDLPADTPILSWLASQWRVMISSLGGQLTIAGISLLLLFVLWQAGEISFLHFIPSQTALFRIYSRLEKASVSLLPNLSEGHTPRQFGLALTHKLATEKNQFLKRIFFSADTEIDRIVTLYSTQVFSQHPPTRSQTRKGIYTWFRLRWKLWIAGRWHRFQ